MQIRGGVQPANGVGLILLGFLIETQRFQSPGKKGRSGRTDICGGMELYEATH